MTLLPLPRFYTLMVLSTALFDKPAFKNLVCNGLVLAADGKKMSKRLQNYPVSACDTTLGEWIWVVCFMTVDIFPAASAHCNS